MMNSMKWSKSEKSISRKAFQNAYGKECNRLIEIVKEKAEKLSEPDQLWELNNYLYRKRREIDQKYDYRYSVLIAVFSRLLMEGWLKMEDLNGLDDDKIQGIQFLVDNF